MWKVPSFFKNSCYIIPFVYCAWKLQIKKYMFQGPIYENSQVMSMSSPVTPTSPQSTPAIDSVLMTSTVGRAVISTPRGKRKAINENLTNDVLESVQNHFKKPVSNKDRFDIFGENVAAKLRDLIKNQRILAEKIINETLFEAEMESLTISHRVVGYSYDNSTPSPISYKRSPTPSQQYYTNSHFEVLQMPQVSQPTMPVPQPRQQVPQATQQVSETTQQVSETTQQNYSPVVHISIPESASSFFSDFN